MADLTGTATADAGNRPVSAPALQMWRDGDGPDGDGEGPTQGTGRVGGDDARCGETVAAAAVPTGEAAAVAEEGTAAARARHGRQQ